MRVVMAVWAIGAIGCAGKQRIPVEPIPYLREGHSIGMTPVQLEIRLPDDPAAVGDVVVQALQSRGYGVLTAPESGIARSDIVKLSIEELGAYNAAHPAHPLPDDGRDVGTSMTVKYRLVEGAAWPEVRFDYVVRIHQRGFFRWWWSWRGDYQASFFVEPLHDRVHSALVQRYPVLGP